MDIENGFFFLLYISLVDIGSGGGQVISRFGSRPSGPGFNFSFFLTFFTGTFHYEMRSVSARSENLWRMNNGLVFAALIGLITIDFGQKISLVVTAAPV